MALNFLNKMWREEKAFIGHDTHRIGHLQGRYKHFILPYSQRCHRAGIPGTVIFLIICKRIRNIATVFTWQINSYSMTETKFCEILLPGFQTVPDIKHSRVINRKPESIAEKRVTGMCDRQPQIGCVSRNFFITFHGMLTSQVNSQAWITAGLRYHAFVKSDQRTQWFIR